VAGLTLSDKRIPGGGQGGAKLSAPSGPLQPPIEGQLTIWDELTPTGTSAVLTAGTLASADGLHGAGLPYALMLFLEVY